MQHEVGNSVNHLIGETLEQFKQSFGYGPWIDLRFPR